MPNNQQKLSRRREVSLLLKEKLIEALDIPYEPRDIGEDIALMGSGSTRSTCSKSSCAWKTISA